jgi:hypothetical protein
MPSYRGIVQSRFMHRRKRIMGESSDKLAASPVIANGSDIAPVTTHKTCRLYKPLPPHAVQI